MAAPLNNRNAAKAKDWETAIRKAIAQYPEPDVLRKIADQLVSKALNGEQFAITEIGNRLDGKPAQSIDLSGSLESKTARDKTDDELAAEADALRAALGEQPRATGKARGAKQLN